MFDGLSKYGLAEPELVDIDGDFRVNFYRSSVTLKVTEKVADKFTEREMSVIRLIKNNPRITTTAMSMELGKSRKTISAIIKSIKDRNIIEREGSDRNGIWIIKQMTLNSVQKSKNEPASIMYAKAKKPCTLERARLFIYMIEIEPTTH